MANKKTTPLKNPLKGNFKIPSDKSISHRAALFGSLIKEPVLVTNFSAGGDCKSTINVLKALGVDVDFQSANSVIISNKNGFKEPEDILYAGNSGTTIRLMSGILAGSNFYSVITGDESLKKRPMARVINPLKQMGANIWAREQDNKAPIAIKGTSLNSINYESPIASAQVKSCILLAGMNAKGETTVTEPHKSRSHSERMLEYLGANIEIDGNTVKIKESRLIPKQINIPGDISSAAFFLVAGAIVPDSEMIIQDVGLNPTRTGIIDILKSMGADISILNERIDCNEEVGDIKIRYSSLKGITIEGEIIPRIIDELPIIAVAATQAEGETIVKDAQELRKKESDRITAICTELKKLGAEIQETEDGFIIQGKRKLEGNCSIETYHDHRIAMSAYVAGLICENDIEIIDFDWVNISFPEFTSFFEKLAGM